MISKLLLSGEYLDIINKLKNLGFDCIPTKPHNKLASPVRYHSDMQVFIINKIAFILDESKYLYQCLSSNNYYVINTEQAGAKYPKNVLCNGKLIGNKLVCNPNTISKLILDCAEQNQIEVLSVKQGYTGCSICVVDENSVITSDSGIEKVLSSRGFDVLLIETGHITLHGYNYGFIGGCSGSIDNKMIFTGNLDFHPNNREIREFINTKNKEIIQLTDSPLLDIGGIVIINTSPNFTSNYTK